MAFGDHRSGAPVVKGVVEYLLQRGVLVSVSDSQAMGTFQKVLKESGLRDALKGLNVQFREFREFIKVDIGEPFNGIEIARDVMEADAVVNLPKLKTHAQMLMTLGVKNLFGCIEVCPHGALRAEEPVVGKAIRKLKGL